MSLNKKKILPPSTIQKKNLLLPKKYAYIYFYFIFFLLPLLLAI